MKSLFSMCLVAGSAWVATHTSNYVFDKGIPDNTSFFTCNINGNAFRIIAGNDSALTTAPMHPETLK